jgi:hypothetical protein
MLFVTYTESGGRDRAVGTGTRYGLNGSETESRCREDFPCSFRTFPKPTRPPVQWVPRISFGVKQPERGADFSPSSSAELANGFELYFRFPSVSA